ncbi:hypothetical protein MTR_2g090920 [Medicago truncatula]|uniref:Uncharacterized protein n=1 Tax=Medicago truncatula TaxID=3880 RepID=A0A072VBQ4_MEDTR|nr:hypothetical protein MTR_2g090920 [Medicago truncatula]
MQNSLNSGNFRSPEFLVSPEKMKFPADLQGLRRSFILTAWQRGHRMYLGNFCNMDYGHYDAPARTHSP